MKKQPLISCENVTKRFRRASGSRLLREVVSGYFRRPQGGEEWFTALRNVSFAVQAGESLAVVGYNGAGKSTLLSLLSGLALPDQGSVKVNGRVAGLLELGAGFHPDLTGAENILLNASLLGFSESQAKKLFEPIIEFSGLQDFIGQPLRTYSTGMWMRLAFSVAVNLDPDVLLVDEVLAVGDQSFQAKCIDRIAAMRREGRTLVCVSHSCETLKSLCQKAVWLDQGELVLAGSIDEVMAAYQGQATGAPQPAVEQPV